MEKGCLVYYVKCPGLVTNSHIARCHGVVSGWSFVSQCFSLAGAPGVTALRLALGTLILIAFFKPWRLRFAKEQRLPLLFYGVSLGTNYLFYLFHSRRYRWYCGGAGVHRTTGGGAVLFSSPVDFVWVVLAVLGSCGLWRPLGQNVSHVDLTGCALALGRGLLGYLHFKWATRRSGTWPCDGGNWFVDCSVNFRANWSASGW